MSPAAARAYAAIAGDEMAGTPGHLEMLVRVDEAVTIVQSLQPHGRAVLETSGNPSSLPSARQPSKVLYILNNEYPIERFDKYFTIVYLIIDCLSGRITYSSAGHPPPLLMRASGLIEPLDVGGPMIGLGDMLPFEDGHARLMKGDRLFLHTDGIAEYCHD